MVSRSNSPEVRNPLLSLPAAQAVMALPPEAKQALRLLLNDLRRNAAERAEQSWRSRKGPLACYWKAVSVYAGHAARLCK